MKAHLDVRGLCKRFGSHVALDEVSFSAARGELLALVGPSGCGKTTVLNSIAGFVRPDAGSISVDDRAIDKLPPEKRGTAMVFQNYALFPHLTVERNVAFGLEMRGVPASERGERIARALDLVHLSGLESRHPRELSGGQQQRVALARAIVVDPAILLLDEPLSNLDALLRKTMREEMREILRQAQTTVVFVTHDLEEALVLADRIVLMQTARVEQIGTPREIYERPRTLEAAHFMGATNVFEGISRGGSRSVTRVETALGTIDAEASEAAEGVPVRLVIRPERVFLGERPGENILRGRIARTSYLGSANRYEVAIGETTIVAVAPTDVDLPLGAEIAVSWFPADAKVLLHADG